MKRSILAALFLVIVLALATATTYAISVKYPFVYINRFPDEGESLGFGKGNLLSLGAFVIPGDFPVTEVTAKNLDTGLILRLTTLTGVDKIYKGKMTLYHTYESGGKFPPFDPSKHLGVWEIRAKDEKGNEVAAKTHRLDKVGEMPFVGDIKASGNPLAPTISWSAPKEGGYPPECKIRYAVRLLKDIDSQLYRSKYTDDTKHQIPEGVLKSEDIPGTYIRVECQCVDPDDKEYAVPVELRSDTFRPLKEALGQ